MWRTELGFKCVQTVNSYCSVWDESGKYIHSSHICAFVREKYFLLCTFCLIFLQDILCCLYWKGERNAADLAIWGGVKKASDVFINCWTSLEITAVLSIIIFIPPKKWYMVLLSYRKHLLMYLQTRSAQKFKILLIKLEGRCGKVFKSMIRLPFLLLGLIS